MAGEKLNTLDWQLCNYLLSTAFQGSITYAEYPPDPAPVYNHEPVATRIGRGRLQPVVAPITRIEPVAEWIGKRQSWPEALRRYCLAMVTGSDYDITLLLTDKDIRTLEGGFEAVRTSTKWWVPYKELHNRYIDSVGEVRQNLSLPAADDWSKQCKQYAAKLEREKLSVQDGIGIIREWISDLRRLLSSMGATEFLPFSGGESGNGDEP